MPRVGKINPAHELSLPLNIDLIRKIVTNVQPDLDGAGCWVWLGHKDRNGYGQIRWNKKMRWVHRVTYAMFKRRIPAGMQVDHKCLNKSCCNPDHLRVMSHSANSIDGRKRQAEKTETPF